MVDPSPAARIANEIRERLKDHAAYCEFNKPRGCDCEHIGFLRRILDLVQQLSAQQEAYQALIAKWREAAAWEVEQGSPEFGKGLDQCADELAACLLAWKEPNHHV